MNGYKILADAHRKAGQEHKAALFDFLGDCTEEDICTLFDSSAFNDIAKGYLRRALLDLQDDNTITSEQAAAIRERHAGLFDEINAEQAQEIQAHLVLL